MTQTRLMVTNLLTARGLRLQRLLVDSICDDGRWQDCYTVHYTDQRGRMGQVQGAWPLIQRQIADLATAA